MEGQCAFPLLPPTLKSHAALLPMSSVSSLLTSTHLIYHAHTHLHVGAQLVQSLMGVDLHALTFVRDVNGGGVYQISIIYTISINSNSIPQGMLICYTVWQLSEVRIIPCVLSIQTLSDAEWIMRFLSRCLLQLIRNNWMSEVEWDNNELWNQSYSTSPGHFLFFVMYMFSWCLIYLFLIPSMKHSKVQPSTLFTLIHSQISPSLCSC